MKNKKIKVCLILPNYYPVPSVKGGAVETLVDLITKENEKYNKLDITCVSIYNKLAEQEAKKMKNTKYIYIKEKIFGFILIKHSKSFFGKVIRHLKIQYKLYTTLVYKKIKDKEFDIIVVEGGNLGDYKSLLRKFPKSISVAHLHFPLEGSKKINYYDFYISCSEFVKSKLSSNKIIDKNKIYNVTNKIDSEKFQLKVSKKEKEELKKSLGIKKEDLVITFCGRIMKEKGIKELIMAFKKVLKSSKEKNYKLLIIGSYSFGEKGKSPFERELKAIVEDIKDNIIFTGFIHNDILYKYYQITDVFSAPSIWEEANGLIISEALASGVPVLTANKGGIPEVATDDCSVKVEVGDNIVEDLAKELEKLLKDEKRRKLMSKAGIKKAKKITSKIYYEEMFKTFSDIVKEGKK